MARASTARHSVQGGGSGKHAQACVDRQRAAVLPTRPLVPPSCNLLTPFTRSQAADLEWGRGAGCDFLLSSCQDFISKNPQQDLFCPQGYENGAGVPAAS
jgi:hypothetical protein